jgi:hypothetical protein
MMNVVNTDTNEQRARPGNKWLEMELRPVNLGDYSGPHKNSLLASQKM